MSERDEKDWNGAFKFVCMADTQLGMATQDKEWEKECEFMRKAIRHVNEIKPRFVVVCGDLVNAYPHTEGRVQELQAADFKKVASEIDESIPLVCVCGNHGTLFCPFFYLSLSSLIYLIFCYTCADVGDQPTRATIATYKERFGDDYFSYWVGGVRFIVLNTQLHKDASKGGAEAEAQDSWLELEVEKSKSDTRTIALSHIPPFINDSNEDDGYFNLDKPVRRKLLSTLRRGGCTHWFCGHYHRNAGGVDRGVSKDKDDGKETPLEVVISSAVGCVLINNGIDPLGLKGFKLPPVLDEETSGMRVVNVEESSVSHEWYTLAQLDQGDYKSTTDESPKKKSAKTNKKTRKKVEDGEPKTKKTKASS